MPNCRFIFLVATSLFTSNVWASDWQYAGFIKSGDVEAHQFFDSEGVSRVSPDIVRVWVKAVRVRVFDRYFKSHRKLIVEKAARRVANNYVPRFVTLGTVNAKYEPTQLKDVAVDITTYEVAANESDIQASTKLYFEIDCSGQRIKLLQSIAYSDRGVIQSPGSKPSAEYQFIAPDSNGQWLSQLVCPSR